NPRRFSRPVPSTTRPFLRDLMRTHNTFFEKDRQAEIISFLSSDYFYCSLKIKRIDVILVTSILFLFLIILILRGLAQNKRG
ncbi:hypothetical protein, partial [Haemophilus sp. C1]|uniref:hypothetical protein n=1 Tax=Haemophilus sp. C1 TaxID=1661745 RepID=UPI001E5D3226